MKVLFTKNERYDAEAIFLHCGENFIIELKDVQELDDLIENLQRISEEIKQDF